MTAGARGEGALRLEWPTPAPFLHRRQSLKATVHNSSNSTMVSRKKAAGKARKAARAKAKEERNNHTTSISDRLAQQMSNELKQEQETAQLLERMWQMEC